MSATPNSLWKRLLQVPDIEIAPRWGVISLIDSVGTGMLLPISVLYFTVVVGLDPTTVGLGLGASGLVATAFVPLTGVLIDRYGSKTMLIGIFALAGASHASYVLVGGVAAFLAVTALSQIADHAAHIAKRTFVAELTEGGERIELLAFQRSIRNVGYGVGGLVTAAVLAIGSDVGYQVVVVVSGLTYGFAIALIRPMPFKAPVAPDIELGPSLPKPKPARYKEVLRDRKYVGLTTFNVLVRIHATAFVIGMPLWISQQETVPIALVGLFFTVNTVLVVVLQVPLSRGIAEASDTPPVYLKALGAFVVAAVAYTVAGMVDLGPVAIAVGVFLVAIVAHTVAELYGSVGEWTVSVQLAPEATRGRHLAFFGLSVSLHQAIGPAVVTLLITRAPMFAWFALAGMLAVGALVTSLLVSDRASASVGDPAELSPTDTL